jgi:4-cresol dehydrogenase (hydroxylating)
MTHSTLAAFVRIVGPEHVVVEPDALAAAERATFATSARIAAIVRPADRDEVQRCVRAANEHGVPLYPISRGKNWGLGSRVPTLSGAVLLDLGRLDRIVDYDETMAHVTVGPGVTFGQLTTFLAERGHRHFVSMTGSTLESSVIGNTVERGDGVGPLGDRVAHVCALEVVLPTGEVVETGFARFAGARTARLYRSGVGPALDGLFTQSNLGIVTRMTVWLTPVPAVMLAFRFAVRDGVRLGGLVDAARTLRLEGTVQSLVAIWNDYRVLSTRMQFPWGHTGGVTPLPRTQLESLKQGVSEAAWYGMGAVYAASPAQANAARMRICEMLAPAADALVFEEKLAGSDDVHTTVVKGAADEFAVFGSAAVTFEILQGRPQQASLASAYFRKPTPPPATDRDPDRDRCGVLWSCPVVPLAAEDCLLATALCERRMLEHGFEPMLALLAQHDRTAYLVPILCFDRDVPGEDERAMACHDVLLAELIAAGYPPYRLGVQSMHSLPAPTDDSLAIIERLKRTLDPNDILAPGRYDFRRRWPGR